MKYLPYILKHLRKNWIRTLSTMLAMALCIFLIGSLQTLLKAFYGGLENASTERLVTRNRVSLVFPLPLSYESRIAGVPGVRRVAKSNWFGGVRGTANGQPDMKNFFPNFAVEAEPYLAMWPEYGLTAAEKQAFLQDLRGCIIGPALAEKFGWRVGSTIQLESTIPPYRIGKPFDFVVSAVYRVDEKKHPNHSKQLMIFHWKYLHEATGQRAGVGTYYTQIANPSQAPAVAAAIDRTFENSDAETKTETEGQFVAGFLSMVGDLALILNAIGLAVAFTILAVSANTMSMSIRERRGEIAVLKTLGFSSGLVLALVLGEALVIGLIGGGLGVGLASLLVANAGTIPGLNGFGMSLSLTPGLVGLMLVISGVIGLLAGLTPAVNAYRSSITAMLRQV
jgi:putative ABC transport system permease protein